MEEVEKVMVEISKKENPTQNDIQKYVRYLINVKKYTDEKIYEELSKWDEEKLAKAIKEVARENSKPRPKRYYVSLKEPLEESF
ncbi:MAG: hypothetical protein ABIJ34_01355 [archaeon]